MQQYVGNVGRPSSVVTLARHAGDMGRLAWVLWLGGSSWTALQAEAAPESVTVHLLSRKARVKEEGFSSVVAKNGCHSKSIPSTRGMDLQNASKPGVHFICLRVCLLLLMELPLSAKRAKHPKRQKKETCHGSRRKSLKSDKLSIHYFSIRKTQMCAHVNWICESLILKCYCNDTRIWALFLDCELYIPWKHCKRLCSQISIGCVLVISHDTIDESNQ